MCVSSTTTYQWSLIANGSQQFKDCLPNLSIAERRLWCCVSAPKLQPVVSGVGFLSQPRQVLAELVASQAAG